MGKTQPQLRTLHIRAWWMQSETTFARNNQKPARLFCCFIWGSHLAVCPWDECNTPRDGGQVTEPVWSQWDCCLRPGEGDEMFSGCGGGDTSGRKTGNIFLSAFSDYSQLLESLPPYRLLSSGHKQTNSLFSPPDPYIKLLPGGCCSRNEVQAFDPAPERRLKGCHFGFRTAQRPTAALHLQARASRFFLFFYFYLIHTFFIMWPAYSASPQLSRNSLFLPSTNG